MTRKLQPRRFRSGRGRPRCHATESKGPDLGTPELILKRAYHATVEPIDLCLERKLINEKEHRSAMHLRWLHTVRYGAPSITAFDLSRGDGTDILIEDDPEWRACREREYHEAVSLLRARRYDRLIIPCVIYNEWPAFLVAQTFEKALQNPSEASLIQDNIIHFSEGLRLLSSHWQKRY